MSATLDSLSDIAGADEELDCYSRLYSARARVLEPADVEELRRIFACARESGHRVTLRGGGHSFDAQSLGDDIVVSMARFDSIELIGKDRVKVGSGVTWGRVFAELEPRGLVPAVTVTTENATTGGTLSGDCLSRFSPAYGKEGGWIDEFELLTTAGDLITCVPPKSDEPAAWSREERAFAGAIGGLGYLGVVVSITYRLLTVGQAQGHIRVRTIVRKYRSFDHLARDLIPAAKGCVDEDADPNDPQKLDAIWSAVQTRRDGTQRALLFTSAFAATTKLRRMPLHRPKMLIRIPVEWVMRITPLSRVLWRFYFHVLFKDREEYVDELPGYTFFMDGNARAKHVAQRLGFTLRNVQQTFVVPSDPHTEGGWDRARDDLVEWLQRADEFLRERNLYATLHDVLFLPRDFSFRLSASADMAGFAVSYAFETSNQDTLERAQQAFTELADVLWDKFGGRVYLVKNVHAKPGTLEQMYHPNAGEFFDLKRELDPDGILRNAFIERTFPRLLERV